MTKFLECNFIPEIRKEMTIKSNKTKEKFTEKEKENSIEKRKKTCLSKYGVDNVTKLKEINENRKQKISIGKKLNTQIKDEKKLKQLGFDLIFFEKDEFILKCHKCQKSFNIKRYLLNQRNRFDITICLNCNPIGGTSNFQINVLDFIKDNYKNEILNNYKQYKKYEIDIFLPDLKLGIECNGLWWHSELYRDKNYHIEKKKYFEKIGIEILNIWEDDWKFKKDIIKSRLKSKLNILENKIGARKCQIKYLNKSESKLFLDKNHIQGFCISKINIGLLYNNEILSIATFGSARRNLGKKSKISEYELLRFCNKNNVLVMGALSKILNFFIKEYSPEKIFSYCDYSCYDGRSYIKSGFKYEKNTIPNYWYFQKDIGIRLNRWRFRKDLLVKKGYDVNKTEIEIMKNIGYYRIWDCGSKLFILTNSNSESPII